MAQVTATLNKKTRVWEVTLPNMDVVTAPTAHRLIAHLEKKGWILTSKTDDQIVLRSKA